MTCKKKHYQVPDWSSTAENSSRGSSNSNKQENGRFMVYTPALAPPRSLCTAVKVCVCASSVSLRHNYTIVVDTSQMSGPTHHTQCEVSSLALAHSASHRRKRPHAVALILNCQFTPPAHTAPLRVSHPSTQALQQA